jgi:hypothetical protein
MQGLFKLLQFSRRRLGLKQVVIGFNELIIEVVVKGEKKRNFVIIWSHLFSSLAVLNGRIIIFSKEVVFRSLPIELFDARI